MVQNIPFMDKWQNFVDKGCTLHPFHLIHLHRLQYLFCINCPPLSCISTTTPHCRLLNHRLSSGHRSFQTTWLSFGQIKANLTGWMLERELESDRTDLNMAVLWSCFHWTFLKRPWVWLKAIPIDVIKKKKEREARLSVQFSIWNISATTEGKSANLCGLVS